MCCVDEIAKCCRLRLAEMESGPMVRSGAWLSSYCTAAPTWASPLRSGRRSCALGATGHGSCQMELKACAAGTLYFGREPVRRQVPCLQ